MRYNDPEAIKPRDGEVFVSRILKIEPESVIFKKPVTVFLSHSLYEDDDFRHFYDLIVENINSSGCQELATERISSIEGSDYFSSKHNFPLILVENSSSLVENGTEHFVNFRTNSRT